MPMHMLSSDVFEIILHMMSLSCVYRLKCTSKSLVLCVANTLSNITSHNGCVHVCAKNIALLARDMRRIAVPIVLDRMSRRQLNTYIMAFAPSELHLNQRSVTLFALRKAIHNMPACVRIVKLQVCQGNLLTIVTSEVCLNLQELELSVTHATPLEMVMQWMNMKQQHIRLLRMRGCLADMEAVYTQLPIGLQSLRIDAKIGVHDTGSLQKFMELALQELDLHYCYEVCEQPGCINYEGISNSILQARSLPKRLAMAPLPSRAMEWCLRHGTRVIFERSKFFEYEYDHVMKKYVQEL